MKIETKSRVRQYWRNAMHSVHCKISRGAEYIWNSMTSGHRDQWRKNDHRHK